MCSTCKKAEAVYGYRCRECNKASCRARYWKNPDKNREQKKRSYAENPEALREAKRAYYAKNADKMRECARRWQAKNVEFHRQRAKEWYRNNLDRAKEARKRWAAENLDKIRLYGRSNIAKRKAAMKGNIVSKADYAFIASRDGMICHLCLLPVTKATLSFDHVIPLSRGGAHAISNIKVAHLKCNQLKGARTP